MGELIIGLTKHGASSSNLRRRRQYGVFAYLPPLLAGHPGWFPGCGVARQLLFTDDARKETAEKQRGGAATKAKLFLTQRRRESAKKRGEDEPSANLCEPLRPLR